MVDPSRPSQPIVDWALFRRFRYLLGSELSAQAALRGLKTSGTSGEKDWGKLYGAATRIACRTIADYQYRKDGFREELLIERSEFPHEPPPEKMAWMRFILGDTPPQMQRLAIYRFIDGMGLVEIAELESRPQEEIKALLSRFTARATEIIQDRISRDGISVQQASVFRMDCSISGKQEGCPSEKRLDQAIGKQDLLASHLKKCSDCRRRMRLRMDPPSEFRVQRKPKESKYLLWLGAGTIFLIGLGCGYFW